MVGWEEEETLRQSDERATTHLLPSAIVGRRRAKVVLLSGDDRHVLARHTTLRQRHIPRIPRGERRLIDKCRHVRLPDGRARPCALAARVPRLRTESASSGGGGRGGGRALLAERLEA